MVDTGHYEGIGEHIDLFVHQCGHFNVLRTKLSSTFPDNLLPLQNYLLYFYSSINDELPMLLNVPKEFTMVYCRCT